MLLKDIGPKKNRDKYEILSQHDVSKIYMTPMASQTAHQR